MTVEEMKAALAAELKAFQESLTGFADKASMEKALSEFKADMAKQLEGAITKDSFETLEKAIKAQGEVISALKLQGGNSPKENFKSILTNKIGEIEENLSKGHDTQVFTAIKDVMSGNVTPNTLAYRETQVGQIPRGVPYIRDLVQVVNLGGNTANTVRWFEQTAITNNAKNTAEDRVVGSQSNATWAEKNLTGKRIVDWVKIGLDQIKDVDFILGEIQILVNRNMRLKENDQLVNGLGIGNEITGLLTYAKEFDTTGIEIVQPNIIDLVGKIRTQIDTDMLGAAMPNYWLSNRQDVDAVRFAKETTGQYIFPNWAIGNGDVAVGGMSLVENPLVTKNTLICGDFSLATLFVWDDLVIEFAQIEDDKKTGKTTILAYMRENLRVKECEKNGFVKVSDIDVALAAIEKQ